MTAEEERAAIVAWHRSQAGEARAEIVEYRGAGDIVGALCSGERILAHTHAAAAIERGDHLQEKEQ